MTSTYKLTTIVDKRDIEHANTLMEEMLDATAISITEIKDDKSLWKVEAYFQEAPDKAVALNILDTLPNTTRQNTESLTIEELPDEDWVAKVQSNLSPVIAGNITIHGSHDNHKFAGQSLAIQVDAGQAFGTAHHGTTKGCLLALQHVMKQESFSNILDLGTGSGVLAIAAAKLQPTATITATDIDLVSTQVAAENCADNKAKHLVHTLHANGLKHRLLQQRMPFDLLIANILAGPLIKMAPEISKAVVPNGSLILSGLLQAQTRSIVATYRNHGFTLCKRFPLGDWMTLILIRR